MTDSLVHAAFDPYPYTAFSACVEAIGVMVAIRRSHTDPSRTSRNAPSSSAYRPAGRVDRALHPFGLARS